MYKSIPKLIEAKPMKNFSLFLVFSDGTEGMINLSDVPRNGLFQIWEKEFDNFKTEGNILKWNDEAEVDADAFYLKLIGKNFFEYAGN
ncbi:MAG: DUF2442 domain-containing protein [Bergeyella sp.]